MEPDARLADDQRIVKEPRVDCGVRHLDRIETVGGDCVSTEGELSSRLGNAETEGDLNH